MVHELKRLVRVPILCSLQGDDIFLESLPEPYRGQAMELIRQHCREIDGFIATSAYYADFMAGYFDIPRVKIHVVYPGLNLKGHGARRAPSADRPFTIGYFARICPEKGLHQLVEAFRLLRQMPGTENTRLHVSGWLGENNRAYFDDLRKQMDLAGLGDSFGHVECPDHASKVRFLQELDVLSVPTLYREPKGLYVLEALANGVPVVQPRHGSFPELVEMTGGGLLVSPNDPEELAGVLRQVLDNRQQVEELGRKGQSVVQERFTAERMAQDTLAVYARYLP
jgi:glycosyltransferase involved in cell wall biosynthesis